MRRPPRNGQVAGGVADWIGVDMDKTTDVYVVHTPKGFTESFDQHTIKVLERLGLIEHERDGYAVEDGGGRGVGPLHRYYREAAR